MKYESPYHPGNTTLTALRRRQAKGNGMRKTGLGIVGAIMLVAGIIGVIATVSADGGGPSKSSYDLEGCVYWNAGWVCEGTPGAGSPEPAEPTPTMVVRVVPTVTPDDADEVEGILVLPATGSGSTAAVRHIVLTPGMPAWDAYWALDAVDFWWDSKAYSAGSAVQDTVSGADSGLHYLYRCENGILWRWAQWGTWVAPDHHSWYWHHHITSVEGRVAIGVCY